MAPGTLLLHQREAQIQTAEALQASTQMSGANRMMNHTRKFSL